MKKVVIIHYLRIFIGLIFIISAILKLFPIEIFEIQFIYENGISWKFTPIFSRIVISIELVIGILLIVNLWTKKIGIPLAITLLSIFSFFLFYQLFTIGNQENCGCFGTLVPFNTIESLLKNGFLIIGLIYCFQGNEWISKWKSLFLGVFTVITIILFLIYPVNDIRNFEEEKLEKNNNFLNLLPISTKNEQLVIFVSATCSHCENLTKKLSILNKRKKTPPIHVFFLENQQEEIADFFTKTNSHFSYSILPIHLFLSITKGKVPQIYHIQENKILHHWTSKNFNPDVFL